MASKASGSIRAKASKFAALVNPVLTIMMLIISYELYIFSERIASIEEGRNEANIGLMSAQVNEYGMSNVTPQVVLGVVNYGLHGTSIQGINYYAIRSDCNVKPFGVGPGDIQYNEESNSDISEFIRVRPVFLQSGESAVSSVLIPNDVASSELIAIYAIIVPAIGDLVEVVIFNNSKYTWTESIYKIHGEDKSWRSTNYDSSGDFNSKVNQKLNCDKMLIMGEEFNPLPIRNS